MKYLFIFVILLSLSHRALFAEELEKVSLQLQWLHQFQFAGFYVAKENGYYKDVGLDVEIRPFTQKTDILPDLQKQKATYATGRSSIIIEQSQNKNLVIIDAIFEHSPSILLTTDLTIINPHDLRNKKIMVTEDQAAASSFYAMLSSQGLHSKDLIHQTHSFNINDLIEGKTDAMASYISNEPFILKEKGIDFTVLNPKDYGYDFYGDLLITSSKEIKEHPQRTKKFVQASRKGWKEAFKNIEETASLIYNKYNQQNKSLASLVYEGQMLKPLCCDDSETGPVLNYKRFDKMADFYLFNNLISAKPDLMKLLDPLHFNRKTVTVGVLAKRGMDHAIKRWEPLIEHMNFQLSLYNIILKPLSFEDIEEAVKNETIDFVLTNSMQYVQLEAKYGTSRMATFLNDFFPTPTSDYGAVIFTHASNKNINVLKDVKGKTFGAVNPVSFGGWIMAKKIFLDNDIKEKDFASLEFLQTHDKVVNAVLSKSIDVGTVRTDTLEVLSQNGKIDLKNIKIINPTQHNNFPYLVSTELYPEWSFAKMKNTENEISNAILSDLLDPLHLKDPSLASWSIPLNYKPIHDLLKSLQMEPYKHTSVTYKTIFKEYYLVIIGILILIISLMLFSRYLNILVSKRTEQLLGANARLKLLAETDELTKLANRRQFMDLSKRYFDIAQRNNTPLVLLSLDIDWFKKINDTYGHDIGDEVLKLFARTIEKNLRKSDFFARIGGEEFSIVLQNTTNEDALFLAKKIRKSIETVLYTSETDGNIDFTVSIGVSALNQNNNTLQKLLKSADDALYTAKRQGRNKVIFE